MYTRKTYKKPHNLPGLIMRSRYIQIVTIALTIFVSLVFGESIPTQNMSRKERNDLRNEAREMFYHAYRAYMDNAYPADELMPLSCSGRYRGVTPSRGDMDDILGNYITTEHFIFTPICG
ncbi:PREDICTED: ER degradation-enhancing alpha-mannosidase-like protein 3 isoform X2 [Rhagoletis zephyria]|uniref:ER degradation-enhancing alpha-mannosidase-like protein 3 isoform X2 n=1 Tax=Rhagoletis zephyria TaxID=28612 RepID=UPI000811A0AB|nr:PREDICTED: ER degradation-enhancing alpha-mannosidase-like protein 3 isoform X2 [Rhagoletis zephyria]